MNTHLFISCLHLTSSAELDSAPSSSMYWVIVLNANALECRLWSPGDTPVRQDVDKLAADNQQRMQEGPQLLRGINPRIMQVCILSCRHDGSCGAG